MRALIPPELNDKIGNDKNGMLQIWSQRYK